MMEHQQPDNRQRGTRTTIALVAVVALVLVLLAVLGANRSGATFVDFSSNPGSVFKTGSLTLTNSKDGEAILTLTQLIPGGAADSATATITVSGDYPATVILTGEGDGSALAQALMLTVEDVTGAPDQLYYGPLSDCSSVPLGDFSGARTFQFTIEFPAANGTAGLAGSSTTETFRFTAVAR